MNRILIVEYHKMMKRYEKLFLEEENIRKDLDEDTKYFIDNHISDHKWQGYLEKTACCLGSASIKLKVAKSKMDQIKNQLRLGK